MEAISSPGLITLITFLMDSILKCLYCIWVLNLFRFKVILLVSSFLSLVNTSEIKPSVIFVVFLMTRGSFETSFCIVLVSVVGIKDVFCTDFVGGNSTKSSLSPLFWNLSEVYFSQVLEKYFSFPPTN